MARFSRSKATSSKSRSRRRAPRRSSTVSSRRLDRPGPPDGVWQSRFSVPAAAAPSFLDALEGEGLSVAAFEEQDAPGRAGGLWRIEVLHAGEPDQRDLAGRIAPLAERASIARLDILVAPLPDEDWLARIAEQFPAQRIGRFWVHGEHVREPPPVGAVPLLIDAGLAFGSGEHATTRTCLLALDTLARRRPLRRVLDLGCGSGILAIAAAKCWPARVVAADHDPGAVRVARDNARRNGVAARVQCVVSQGLAHPRVRRSAPYDAILANLLADPLCELAPDLARLLAPRGMAVLAGILTRQAQRVAMAYRRQRLRLHAVLDDGPWTTLVLRASPGGARRSTPVSLLASRMSAPPGRDEPGAR